MGFYSTRLSQEKTMNPYPNSMRTDRVDVLHGVSVPDPYRWLEDISAEETRAWIEAQNELTRSYLERIPERDVIRQRITELWNYEKYGVPFKRGGRYFYTHNDGLQDQNVLYWMASLDANPIELLDPNTLSQDGTVALTGLAVSEDGKQLAYSLSSSGSDWQEWHVRDVDTGSDLEDVIGWSKFSGAAWTLDGKGFFYSRYNEPREGETFKGANYYHKLYFHRMGTPQNDDVLIYERLDQREWGFGGEVTHDGHYLIIRVSLGTNRENGIFYLDLQSNGNQVVDLLNKFDAEYDFIGNDGPLFYFRTDLDAPLGCVIAIDVTHPGRENWRKVIAEADDTLRHISLVQDQFIATFLHDAYSRVLVYNKTGDIAHEIALPGIGSVVYAFDGQQDDKEIFFQYTDFTTPGTIYRYDVALGASTLFRKPAVGFSSDDYITEQIFYDSKDGTAIPMFITRRKDVQPCITTPTFLYGYGGFDIPLVPGFSVAHLVWMEMGGIYAQANLRGGGEYGKVWHDGGRLLNKQNAFDDFVAAAEWLIENGYTSTPKLAIGGRSNGGLLVGACLTQRPELFGACLPAVGVLDMLRFHKFTIGWAWTSDYGSPDNKPEFEALLAYSPYHNIKPGTHYPPTLVTTADHDDRVFPAHSFKFAAALQYAQANHAPVLIRIETKAGHGAGQPTSKLILDATDRWAFLVKNLSLEVHV
ncbi:MAG: S9 family peptidase [Anaerolineae bacterium]|nr:S9 family peptidase [Anaerolineae bacterium]